MEKWGLVRKGSSQMWPCMLQSGLRTSKIKHSKEGFAEDAQLAARSVRQTGPMAWPQRKGRERVHRKRSHG
jgi:hypothetical protein